MLNKPDDNRSELRKTELLGWVSVGVVGAALVPAALPLAGIRHPAIQLAHIALLAAGLAGLLFWYTRVRWNIRRLNELIHTLNHRSEVQDQALAQLEELNRIKKFFINMSSHELRTPLATLQSCLRVIMSGRVTDEADLQKLVTHAYGQAENMMDLIHDLLLLAEANVIQETGFPPEELDVDKTVRMIVERLTPRAAERSVEFLVRVESPPGNLRVNRKMFTQVLLNLASNAFVYSDANKKVLITLADGGDDTIIEVTNWGLVISGEDMKHIFNEFWRSQDAAKYVERGTGLGLSIVKNIVDGWGGRISVKSNGLDGTCFRVEIPRNIDKETETNG